MVARVQEARKLKAKKGKHESKLKGYGQCDERFLGQFSSFCANTILWLMHT